MSIQEEDGGSDHDIPVEQRVAAQAADGAGKKTRADRNRQIRRRDAEVAIEAKRRLKTQRREIDQLAQRTAEIAEHAALLAIRQERREVRLFVKIWLQCFTAALLVR